MAFFNDGKRLSTRRDAFFRGAHYILAGGIAGVAIGGLITPILGLNMSQASVILSAVIGALSVAVIRAFRLF